MLVLQGLIRHGLHPEEAYSVEWQIDNYARRSRLSWCDIFQKVSPDSVLPRPPPTTCAQSTLLSFYHVIDQIHSFHSTYIP